MTIRLYDLAGAADERFSPYCWRVRMALAHKGLDFETVPTPFTQIGRIEGGAHKTVPVIVDGDRVVSDSFTIAAYLEDAYPDAPSLFEGAGGRALSRFVDAWSVASLHPNITPLIVKDIHDRLTLEDRVYFRASREKRLGRPLEEVQAGREDRVERLHKALAPLALMLRQQPFLGGERPLYADYIVFGSLQWPRVISSFALLPPSDDPVTQWFERCLDLFDGLGRRGCQAVQGASERALRP